MKVTERIHAELEKIRATDPNGVLMPEAVVEFARDETTALHSHFEWDDSEAAQQYRIWQARQVIRVCVTVVRQDAPAVRAYVSLPNDRIANGGYRATVEVMREPDQREQLLNCARAELASFRRKYEDLEELSAVFDVIDEVVAA